MIYLTNYLNFTQLSENMDFANLVLLEADQLVARSSYCEELMKVFVL